MDANTAKAVKKVTDVLQLYEDIFKVLDMADFARIVHVGAVVKGILSLAGMMPEDPVMVKLRQLEGKIDKLSRKMTNHFDQLKAFMVEHSFYADVAATASTLTKLMCDTLTHPNHHSVGIFRQACERTPPLQYAYKLISLMEQDSTNPLKKAMAADPLQSKSTFNKWQDIILRVVAEFYALELYVNGLFWNSNMYGPNQLKSRINELQKLMKSWKVNYEKNAYYWPEKAREFIENIQDNNTDIGNQEKCDKLEKAFEDVLSNDSFYILVYNHCGGFDKHSFCYEPSQTILSFRRGQCCVVVYRSKYAKSTSEDNLESIRTDIDRLEANRRFHNCSEDLSREMKEFVSKAGFVGIMRSHLNVAVAYANIVHNRGPGWYRTAGPVFMIAGYE
ncbi:unnamed protein product [Caenorhabditis angaria]|uniref:Uncharacterized protein n=1 Tax=Caenorhabditis angaria TaxID=860376 RepID=A0A9P1IHF1_9PELO|nr:unnamed protein product [Caenorhabditis angaria]